MKTIERLQKPQINNIFKGFLHSMKQKEGEEEEEEEEESTNKSSLAFGRTLAGMLWCFWGVGYLHIMSFNANLSLLLLRTLVNF